MNPEATSVSPVARPNTLTLHIDEALRRSPTLGELTESLAAHLADLDRPRPACPVVVLDTAMLQELVDPQLRQVAADGHHVSRTALLVYLPDALAHASAAFAGAQPQLFNAPAIDLMSSSTYLGWTAHEPGENAVALWMPIPDLGADVWNVPSGWAWVPMVLVGGVQVACGGYFVEAEEVLCVQAHEVSAANMKPWNVYSEVELAQARADTGADGPTPWFNAAFRLGNGTLMVAGTEFRHRTKH